MIKSAIFSPDGAYRYTLKRIWHESSILEGRILGFLMLNPSTADAEVDDPTIRRCISLAEREGYDGIIVENLHPFRSKDPKILRNHPVSVVMSINTYHIRATDEKVDCWIIACGNVNLHMRMLARNILKSIEKPVFCLGLNKNGTPKHPLYLGAGAKMEPFNVGEML